MYTDQVTLKVEHLATTTAHIKVDSATDFSRIAANAVTECMPEESYDQPSPILMSGFEMLVAGGAGGPEADALAASTPTSSSSPPPPPPPPVVLPSFPVLFVLSAFVEPQQFVRGSNAVFESEVGMRNSMALTAKNLFLPGEIETNPNIPSALEFKLSLAGLSQLFVDVGPNPGGGTKT
eukprot:UC1_evm1s1081